MYDKKVACVSLCQPEYLVFAYYFSGRLVYNIVLKYPIQSVRYPVHASAQSRGALPSCDMTTNVGGGKDA